MTKREFLNAVIEANVSEEITAEATGMIEKLDSANESRRESAAKKATEKEAVKAPIREAVYAFISDEPKTATTLIEAAGVDIKPQAIPSLLKPLVEAGKVLKVDIKVTGKGTQRGYVRA